MEDAPVNNQVKTTTLFVDYIPAEIKEGSIWMVVYYVKHPVTKKLVRKRNRIKPLKSKVDMRRLGRAMCQKINERLINGWNPFLEEKNNKQYVKLNDAIDSFVKRKDLELKEGDLRKDTHRTYLSKLRNFQSYLEDKNLSELYCFELESSLLNRFLDYIRYEKGNSAQTRDNYLSFFVTLCNYLFEKNYIVEIPTKKISKTKKKEKIRTLIPADVRDQIFDYYSINNKRFLTLCLIGYYCLLRRTEITRLFVKDLILDKNIITIRSEASKNWKTQNVTIPDVLIPHLKKQIDGAGPNDYLFSADEFTSGKRKMNPDRITKEWIRMRKNLGIPSKYQWYSLKDTGITDLLRSGVPLISVRDQARHHSSKQTDAYTPKDMIKSDSNILLSKVRFTKEQ